MDDKEDVNGLERGVNYTEMSFGKICDIAIESARTRGSYPVFEYVLSDGTRIHISVQIEQVVPVAGQHAPAEGLH